MGRPHGRTGDALLGPGGGLLLTTLGAVALAVLFRATEGHRARLAAEVLGVVVGGGVTLFAVGVRRPSPQVVTRAYASLGAHARALLVAGMAMLFGFAVATAGLANVIPSLRNVPGIGGVITLDWVVSLVFLGTSGAMLLFLGILACRAALAPPDDELEAGTILERLWAASNSPDAAALRRCFAAGRAGDTLHSAWRDALRRPGASHVYLVRSGTVWGKTWSEWHIAGEVGSATRHLVLLSRVEDDTIVAGELYVPAAGTAEGRELSATQA